MTIFAEMLDQLLEQDPQCIVRLLPDRQAVHTNPVASPPRHTHAGGLADTVPDRSVPRRSHRGAEGLCAQHLRSGTRQLSARRLGSDRVQSDAER